MHFISNFVSYDRLTLLSHQFAIFISSISIPKSLQKVVMYPNWKQTLDEEMDALLSRQTWDLCLLPSISLLVVAGYLGEE